MGCGGENMAIQVVTGVVCLMGSAWCSESRFPLFYHALLYRDDFLAQTLRDLPSAGLAVQGTYVLCLSYQLLGNKPRYSWLTAERGS